MKLFDVSIRLLSLFTVKICARKKYRFARKCWCYWSWLVNVLLVWALNDDNPKNLSVGFLYPTSRGFGAVLVLMIFFSILSNGQISHFYYRAIKPDIWHFSNGNFSLKVTLAKIGGDDLGGKRLWRERGGVHLSFTQIHLWLPRNISHDIWMGNPLRATLSLTLVGWWY